MTPSYEELLQGITTWNFQHDSGLTYEITFHGYNPLPDNFHPGTWCYYITIPQEMYPHRWDEMKPKKSDIGYDFYDSENQFFQTVNPLFDSEITFIELNNYEHRSYLQKNYATYQKLKLGCDYGHLYHRQMGYPDTFGSVKLDAEHTVKNFIEAFPDHYVRSRYSGTWDKKENFYVCIGGWLVHKDDEIPDTWEQWKPVPVKDKFEEFVENNPLSSYMSYRIFNNNGKLFLGTRTHDMGGTDYTFDVEVTYDEAVKLCQEGINGNRVSQFLDALKDYKV